MLANQFDSVAIGFVLIAGLLGFWQGREPLVLLIAFGSFGALT